MYLYRDLYSLLSSYELFKLKFQWDLPLHYHIWLSEFMQDLHLNKEFLANQVQGQQQALNSLSTFSQIFKRVERHLQGTQSLYRANLGNFTDAFEVIDWIKEIGQPLTPQQSVARLREIFRRSFEQADELLKTRSSESRSQARSPI